MAISVFKVDRANLHEVKKTSKYPTHVSTLRADRLVRFSLAQTTEHLELELGTINLLSKTGNLYL